MIKLWSQFRLKSCNRFFWMGNFQLRNRYLLVISIFLISYFDPPEKILRGYSGSGLTIFSHNSKKRPSGGRLILKFRWRTISLAFRTRASCCRFFDNHEFQNAFASASGLLIHFTKYSSVTNSSTLNFEYSIHLKLGDPTASICLWEEYYCSFSRLY